MIKTYERPAIERREPVSGLLTRGSYHGGHKKKRKGGFDFDKKH